MTSILLDTNAYDALRRCPEAIAQIRSLCDLGVGKIIATSTIREELKKSPMRGIRDWFPVTVDLDGIGAIGHSRTGQARIGRNDIYDQHRGRSRQVADAIIAESAERYADIFVSDDKRCRVRYGKLTDQRLFMSTQHFIAWLSTHHPA